MQIILMEKLPNLGQLGDVVKVKDGFARNYLIPQGKAKRATQANLAEFEKRRAELGRNALEVVKKNQGGVNRTVEMILKHLDNGEIYVARAEQL